MGLQELPKTTNLEKIPSLEATGKRLGEIYLFQRRLF